MAGRIAVGEDLTGRKHPSPNSLPEGTKIDHGRSRGTRKNREKIVIAIHVL